jgi:hypothetical protein
VLWCALDVALSFVAFGRETCDGFGLLCPQILIRSLLILLRHRSRCWTSEISSTNKEHERDSKTNSDTACYSPSFAWGRDSSWSVFAKGDVVCSFLLLQSQLGPIRLHSIPQRHPQIRLLLRWHALPSLLDIRQRRVGDRVGVPALLESGHGVSYDCPWSGGAEESGA